MIHPECELRFINEKIGFGILATKKIPRGTIVWTRCLLDYQFTINQLLQLPSNYYPLFQKYSYLNQTEHFILCWDCARYMNHSCEATVQPLGSEINIAVRDIQAGEQLTFDYATLNYSHDLTCFCETPRCRKSIKTQDTFTYAEEFDDIIQSSLPYIKQVKQPLQSFIRNPSPLNQILNGSLPIPSVKSLVCVNREHLWQSLSNDSKKNVS